MANNHEHYSKMVLSNYDYRGVSEREIKEHCVDELTRYFRKVLEEKMTIVTRKNPMDYTTEVVGKVVIMSSEEYNQLMRSRIQPPLSYNHDPYMQTYNMEKVDEKAKEVLSEEIRKSKTAEDYLTNRVRQLQNEHLLPKRRPT
jgi:hypothetical protein